MAKSGKRPSPLLLVVLGVAALVLVYLKGKALFGGSAEDAGAAEQGISLDARMSTLKALPGIALARPTTGAGYSPRRPLFDYSESPQVQALARAREQAQVRVEVQRRKQDENRRVEAAKEALLPRPPPQPPPPPPPPTPPAFSYSYIAYLGQIGRPERVAVLLKRGGAASKPLPVREGDTIDNAFVVRKIDLDVVTVGYTEPQFGDRTESVRLIAAAQGSPGGGAASGAGAAGGPAPQPKKGR